MPPLQNGYMYTRWGNPTVDAAANTLARLEGAAGSLLFSSGMAAIVTSMLTFLKSGDHVVSKSLGARQAIYSAETDRLYLSFPYFLSSLLTPHLFASFSLLHVVFLMYLNR